MLTKILRQLSFFLAGAINRDQHQHGDSSNPYDVQSAEGESFTPRGMPNTQNYIRDDINQANPEHFSVETNENGVDSGS